jgi:hypothetical protein
MRSKRTSFLDSFKGAYSEVAIVSAGEATAVEGIEEETAYRDDNVQNRPRYEERMSA